MRRREFAQLAVASMALGAPTEIIDTHAHFYDPARPQGVPWPPKSEALLYRTVLPPEFEAMVKPLGVTGVIKVEASGWLEDNQWILDLAEKHPFIVGVVGNLEPGKPEFRRNLQRFQKNPKFLGIRLGGRWGEEFGGVRANADVIADLKVLAAAGRQLDVIGGADFLVQVLRLADRVPELRMVIDHLPFPEKIEPRVLRDLQQREQLYAKVSNVVRPGIGDPSVYRAGLDELWGVFGEDRVIYGSNWPVSDRVAPYRMLFQIVKNYVANRGALASEKYFYVNAKKAYRF